MKRLSSVLALLPLSMAAFAAPLPPAARAEVDVLLVRLQSSGCEFNRNGSWYGGAEAREHLLKKLEHLEGKDAVHSSEQFIELAASASSISGKPYLVRCGGTTGTPQPSKVWLSQQLKALREDRAK